MAAEEDPSDLFAIPDFWRPPNWLDQTIDENKKQNPLFTFDVSGTACLGATQGLIPSGDVHVLSQTDAGDDVFFKLPSLLRDLASQHAKLPSEPKPQVPRDEPNLLPAADDEDLWLSPSDELVRPSEYKTWESFEQPKQETRPPLFITEAGPAAFDSLLASSQVSDDAVPDVLDAGQYCACLLSLALGRSSILFSWDLGKNSFVKTTPYLRISGISLDLIGAVDSLCLDCGNSARHLQAFAEAAYAAASTPTRVALAGVIGRLVLVVQSELSSRSRDLRSILQLQAAVQPAQSILSHFEGLVKKLAQQKSDEGILSCLFEEAQSSEYRSGLLRAATRAVLRIVSKPWTEFVEEWIGLRVENGIPITKEGPGKNFIKVADKMWVDDQGFQLQEAEYFLDEDKMPTFIPEDMAQATFETGRNLRFLREYHPEHPLSRPDVISSAMPPSLDWQFEWYAISKLEARVAQYRNSVYRAIRGRPAESQRNTVPQSSDELVPRANELGCFGRSEAEVEANVISSIHHLDQPLQDRGPQDELTLVLQSQLYQHPDAPAEASTLSPHWALVPMLSFSPVIEAQSSLVNQECMQLLFSAHHLRVHIDALRQYFLLDNGLLCSRLSHALFDPDMSTAERKSGVALGADGGGVMGLRLGGRQTWPPASSELRLALMGVLSDCYQPPSSHSSSNPPTSSSASAWVVSRTSVAATTLPGDLSFAIRDLSQEEIDRCMSDPDSLEALDFLRLSYKPPPPLRPIFTPAVLARYDRVFRLLLRVLRMLYVTNELVQRMGKSSGGGSGDGAGGMRLSIEARLFIRQVASYFFQRGIAAPWGRFGAWLDGVVAEGEGCGSPDVLRDRLERVLDETLGVLLLRKRQAPVMGLLEEIFGVVLRFAKGLRATPGSRSASNYDGDTVEGREAETADELYKVFRRKVQVFITVCKGLGEKKMAAAGGGTGMGSDGRGGGENPVEQLLVMLDMSGFYTGRRG